MVRTSDLPHLLRLIDDPSPLVRSEVSRALSSFGDGLDAALAALPEMPPRWQCRLITELVGSYRRVWLRDAWPSWYDLDDSLERLETALSLIAEFQDGPESAPALSSVLDNLAAGFCRQDGPGDAEALAAYLFQTQGIHGAKQQYYHPRNSNLAAVVRDGEGIPISLACIYMLVGDRVGLEISGCNWPSHFLARTYVNGVLTLVDCFNGGRCTDIDTFLANQGPSEAAARNLLRDEAPVEIIIGRVLNNLMRAYRHCDAHEDCALMAELRRDLDRRLRSHWR